MSKIENLQTIHQILLSRRTPIPKRELSNRLQCTEKTVSRLLEHLQYLGAPVENDAEGRGVYYDKSRENLFQLPGLWLTADALRALGLLFSLLEGLGEGLLSEETAFIQQQIEQLLQAQKIDSGRLAKKLKVTPIAHKPPPNGIFAPVAESLLQEKKLMLVYQNYAGQKTSRTVSPQTLIYYRENWYLDAWCHKRHGLRTFALARITKAMVEQEGILKVSEQALSQHFASGYGIFAGEANHRATLRFMPPVAQEISLQQWHPEQKSRWDGDDYLLTVPYAKDLELVQDILKHTPHVIVEAPQSLADKIEYNLQQGVQIINQHKRDQKH